jgi:hypothetical protein
MPFLQHLSTTITLAHPIIASSAINSSSSSSATGVEILPVGATGKIPVRKIRKKKNYSN